MSDVMFLLCVYFSLQKETAQLGELVEKMEKTGLQADNDAEKHTGPGDTEPVLRPHYKSLAMKNQKLISTSIPLQENTCPHHDDKLKAEDSAAARGATKKVWMGYHYRLSIRGT